MQLTCATQMTGWQSADGHDLPMCQQNNEIVELSRIISQLAMANHQLASAHSATLARMEALYLELSKDSEDRKQKISTENLDICEDVFRKRLQDEDIEKKEMRRLEQRVVRLERLLAANSFEQCKRCLQEDSTPRSRMEKSENSLKTRDAKNTNDNFCSKSAKSCCESSEQRTSHIVINTIGEVLDDCGDDPDTMRKDVHICCSAHSDDSKTNISRLDKNFCSMNVGIDKVCRRRARLRDDEQDPATRNPTSEEIFRLSEEVERLNTDRLELQSANEKLLCSLTDQKNLVKKLDIDYKVR